VSESLPAVAVAVLLADGRYALQHRDDLPGIAWPGHWGLFGGNLEPGEAPLSAIAREVSAKANLAGSGSGSATRCLPQSARIALDDGLHVGVDHGCRVALPGTFTPDDEAW